MKSTTDLLARVVRPLSWDGNPILVRELRSLFRGRLFLWFLTIATFALSILVFTTGALEANQGGLPASVGRTLFHLFFIIATLVLGIVAPSQSATSLTSEKEQKTLESIILTGLSPWRILWGKFAGSVASMFLVLVAFLPVAGIVLLFGGISPYHILLGYLFLLLLLAPSSGFGVAISAHLSSSRVATIISSLTSVFFTIVLLIVLTDIGDGHSFRSGGGMGGPFFFIDLILQQSFDILTVSYVSVIAIALSGFPTWFYLASALAALRPPSYNPIFPLKVWSVALSLCAILVVVVTSFGSYRMNYVALEETGLRAMTWWGILLVLFSLIFINEPTLARTHTDREHPSLFRKVLAFFGPGAAPTLRFAVALITLSTAALAASIITIWAMLIPETLRADSFVPCILVLSTGYIASAVTLVCFGVLLRIVTGKGVIARLLVIGGLALAVFVPIFVLALSGYTSSSDIPSVAQVSPILPILLVQRIGSQASTVWSIADVVPLVVLCLSLTSALMIAVELKTRSARRAERSARAARDEQARESLPSLPLLQVSRSSLIPGIPEGDDEKSEG